MSEPATAETPPTAPPEAPPIKGSSWVAAELRSRKYRALVGALVTFVTSQFVALQNVWAWIVAIACYIIAVAMEDHATKSARPGDLNITMPGNGGPMQLRTKRVTKDPLGITTTDEVTAG